MRGMMKGIWVVDETTAKMIKAYLKGDVILQVDDKMAKEKAIKDVTRTNPCFGVTQVIFNPPATIVMWTDGTKTVVKCHEEEFDREKGLVMAICKKVMGNKGNYYRVIKKLLSE